MTGRALPPTSAFAADDGAADDRLVRALAGHRSGAGASAAVAAVLADVRVLVPVLPLPETDEDGRRRTATGVVAVAAPDARTALPVFSSLDALSAWHDRARPVPTSGPDAARAALAEGWEILVLDPAGPVTAVVPRPAVHALATGGTWLPAVLGDVVRPVISAAVTRALAGVEHVTGVAVDPGRSAEVRVVLEVAGGLTRSGLDAVLADVGRRLAVAPDVAAGVDTVELQVRPG